MRRPVSCAARSGVPAAFRWLLAILLAAPGCREPDAAPPTPGATAQVTAPHPLVVPDVLQRAGDGHRGTLASDRTVAYPVPLLAGEALLVEVDQAEVDIVLRASDPAGKDLLLADTPVGRNAPETLCLVADRAGLHSIVVSPFHGDGAYSIRVARRQVASDGDRLCFAGALAFQAAERAGTGEREVAYAAAAELWERSGQAFLAGVAWREAATVALDAGRSARGLARFEKALERARQARNPYLEVSVLNRLGMALLERGETAQARTRLEEALHGARIAKEIWGQASALTNLGAVDDFVGRPYRAIDRYAEALSLWRKMGNSAETAQALQNMGVAYGTLDHHERALDLLAEAAGLARMAGDERREASALLAEGWVHYLRGRPADGLPALQRVLEIRRRRVDRIGEAAALDRQGTLFTAARRPAEAERSYLRSLELSRQIGGPLDVAATLTNLGCLYVDTGRIAHARERLEGALTRYRGADDPRALAHVHYCLAKAAVAAHELGPALDHIRRALEVVDRLRHLARTEGHRYRPIWLWQDYAELEIAILLERHRRHGRPSDLQSAFESADLARARTLYEEVVEARLWLPTTSDEVAERGLAEQLDRLARVRAKQRSSPQGAGRLVDAEIRRLRSELERVRAAERAVRRRQPIVPRAVSTDVAQGLVQPGTALLSYVLAEPRSHLLVLTRDGLRVHELASKTEIESHARSFYSALQTSRLGSAQWRLVGEELGGRVLPAGAVPPEVHRLVIVAEGFLHYVPFAAFSSPRSEGRLVGEDFDVSYVPSVSVMAGLRERRKGNRETRVAVFADPVFSPADRRVADRGRAPGVPTPPAPGATMADEDLPRLLFAEEEARLIAEAAGGRVAAIWSGPDASKAAVLAFDLRPFSILHFATHALIDEDFPELSGLSLTRFDRRRRRMDSELRLHEIHRLSLDADLTVLSGCQTALGEHVRGNGLEGLAHGFLYAGSSRVLVTLWSVDDEATAVLMGDFYRRLLREGQRPAAALRQAQTWLRAQHRFESPYYWAPFVLLGDD